ncbi:MAG: hypothetical protein LUD68_08990, partial [Rikenellaceae bacterium]|nr:hypothetical protein [Rikenellaceae bacterium]
VIDYVDQTIQGRTRAGLNVYDADNRAFREHGFSQGNPWFFSAMHRTSFLDHPFAPDSELINTYHFKITDDFDYREIKAVVERAEYWEIEINGQPVRPAEGSWWVDVDFGVVPIGDYLKKGSNTLTTRVSPMTVHHETMPVYILGNFTVNPAARGFSIGKPAENSLKLGSWKEQGMPFYSHGVDYSRNFEITELGERYEVELDRWNGTVAAVYVNGQQAGIIGWPPYRLNVTDYIRPGENRVEVKIVGSFKNLFGNFYVDARGQINPSLMKRAPEVQPSPEEFDLFDYGLFGDLRLLAQ